MRPKPPIQKLPESSSSRDSNSLFGNPGQFPLLYMRNVRLSASGSESSFASPSPSTDTQRLSSADLWMKETNSPAVSPGRTCILSRDRSSPSSPHFKRLSPALVPTQIVCPSTRRSVVKSSLSEWTFFLSLRMHVHFLLSEWGLPPQVVETQVLSATLRRLWSSKASQSYPLQICTR